jgi:transcriptional regulator with XRE-family HTH domain
MKSLADQLKEHFKRSGEAKTDFAARAGVSTMSVTRVMKGKNVSAPTLERVYEGLKRYKADAPNNIVRFSSDSEALSLLSAELRNLADHLDSTAWPNQFKVERFCEFVAAYHSKLDSLRVLVKQATDNV